MITKKRAYGHKAVEGKLMSLNTEGVFTIFVQTKLEESVTTIGVKDLVGFNLTEQNKERIFILKVRDCSGVRLNLTGVSDDEVANLIEDIEEAIEG